ncbi:MAG: hypothetical protein AAFY57_15685 [Cyanobacteria bacterium J06642_2]
MKQTLRQLNDILTYQMDALHLVVDVRLKGPVLYVLLEYVRGDRVDVERVAAIVRDAMDAVFFPDVNRVSIYAKVLRADDSKAERIASFPYQASLETPQAELPTRSQTMRRDYPVVRVFFFFFGLLAAVWLAFDVSLERTIPVGLAIVFGIVFPPLKRVLDRPLFAFMRWLLMAIGGLSLAIACYLLVKEGGDRWFSIAMAASIGVFCANLGRPQSSGQ